ncbi:dihydrolipoyl dehydrogenase [Candidatus Saganbacteria bacterium]|nr:dihydrolipoyl dehydrogenase [Candidatus Saganbacteria bacterium]
MDKFDVIVIGGGPGGYVAAIRAAQLGAKVALIEKDQVGGTCLNRGCIPTKAIIAAINLFDQIKKADQFGITCSTPAIDFSKVIDRKNQVVSKIIKGLRQLIANNKINVISGTAKALEPGKVEIIKTDDSNKLLVVSHKLILATGSSPICLPGLTFDNKKFFTSDDILNLRTVPEKLNIVGGGVIGLHFARIFSSLGTAVTIYEALPEILAGVDEEIIALIKRILKRRGVNILTGTKFDHEQTGNQTLVCVGRTPNLSGLESLKLKMEEGRRVFVNEKMETNAPHVYAVGDLCSRQQLAHVAYEQGAMAAANALGGNQSFSYDLIPYGVYTQPEIAGVGLTETKAKEKFASIKIGKFPFGALGISQAMEEIEGFVKVVADQNGQLLGVHIIGPEATSLIGCAVIALKQKMKVADLANIFQAHPSYPEVLQEAALAALKMGLHTIN